MATWMTLAGRSDDDPDEHPLRATPVATTTAPATALVNHALRFFIFERLSKVSATLPKVTRRSNDTTSPIWGQGPSPRPQDRSSGPAPGVCGRRQGPHRRELAAADQPPLTSRARQALTTMDRHVHSYTDHA